MSRLQNWTDDQEIERLWHGDCANMYSEETKQITYAHRMGLVNDPQDGHWPCYDLGGRSVIDIGGGPVSLLLKCVNAGRRLVVDPCDYPCWVQRRYEEVGIHLIRRAAEDLPPLGDYDEAWIYNCLQHTRDPEVIVRKARETARVVRIFEWLDTPPSPGHPQTLRAALLDDWLEGSGTVERLEGENSCVGLAYYGVFKGVFNHAHWYSDFVQVSRPRSHAPAEVRQGRAGPAVQQQGEQTPGRRRPDAGYVRR